MSEIERILHSGASARDDSAFSVEEALERAKTVLGGRLPPSYVEFCHLGGLSELRFNHRILTPDEILESQSQLPEGLIAFADNGCGDQYCWLADGASEPSVVFVDHETQTYSPTCGSFIEWLRENRF